MHYLSALRYQPNFIIGLITVKNLHYRSIPIWWQTYRASLINCNVCFGNVYVFMDMWHFAAILVSLNGTIKLSLITHVSNMTE